MAQSGKLPERPLSPKQRRFVDLVIKGHSATDAYEKAYGVARSTADTSGPRLMGNVRISAAIAVRQTKAAAKADLTLQAHLDTLNELRTAAAEAEQYSAAVSAEVSRGKASGFYVDKTDIRHSGKVEVRVRIEREGKKVTAG